MESLKTVQNMDKVSIFGPMAPYTKDNGRMTNLKDKVSMIGEMGVNTQAIGQIIK